MTALVDIIHAFAIADSSKVGLAVKQYVKMLLCEVCGLYRILHVNCTRTVTVFTQEMWRIRN